MEEHSPSIPFHTRIAQWPVHWAQMVFLLAIVPHLSSNFPGFGENDPFDIAFWAGFGCVFVDLPLHEHCHPRVSFQGLPQVFCHVVVRYAFGDAVPPTFSNSLENYECSHLCESFWRQYFTKNGLNIADFFLPPSRCVNPLHLTVEKHRNNLARERCSQTWEGGCECGQQPPCLHFSKEETKKMEILFPSMIDMFRRLRLVGRQIWQNWTLFTPEDFAGAEEYRVEANISIIVDEEEDSPHPDHPVLDLSTDTEQTIIAALEDPHWPAEPILDQQLALDIQEVSRKHQRQLRNRRYYQAHGKERQRGKRRKATHDEDKEKEKE